MTSNAPPFDPLHPTPEEDADMLAGYMDGTAGRPPRADGSLAYAHGRRNGINDKAGHTDPEQRALARRIAQENGVHADRVLFGLKRLERLGIIRRG